MNLSLSLCLSVILFTLNILHIVDKSSQSIVSKKRIFSKYIISEHGIVEMLDYQFKFSIFGWGAFSACILRAT